MGRAQAIQHAFEWTIVGFSSGELISELRSVIALLRNIRALLHACLCELLDAHLAFTDEPYDKQPVQ